MKKVICSLMLMLLFGLAVAEVPVKYNHQMCKMEIITTEGSRVKNAKKLIEMEVLAFCKDKYIYSVDLTIDRNNNYIYVIFYNDKGGN